MRSHYGQSGFGYGDLTEEVRLKLQAQFIQGDIFGESSNCKAGIIDENIDAAVCSRDIGHYSRNAFEVCYIELPCFDARR